MTIRARFANQIESVQRLMNFDRDVLDLAIKTLRDLQGRLKKVGIDNPRLLAENALMAIEGIRGNDSLRERYQTIFNQALVLLVSYFASAVHDAFIESVQIAIDQGGDGPLFREELKLSIRELKEVTAPGSAITVPDLFVQSRDISFQDMQSIARSFKTFLDVQIEKDSNINDIILGQACRHAIVHAGAVASERLIRQVSAAHPRKVKSAIRVGEPVQFQPAEVELVAEAMMKYVNALSDQIALRIGKEI